MAQTIKLKRSAVAGRIPSTSDLELGEVAINTHDGKMYIKKTVNGTDSVVEVGSGGLSASAFTQYTYTATAGQTDFTGADNSGATLDVVDEFSNVFMNGILLDPGVDYDVSSDGLTLTLTGAAEVGDILQINSFDQAVFNGTLNVDALALEGMAGEMVWNSDEETINVPLNSEVTLQVGQEFVFRGKATEAISNGEVVMFAGAQGGHLLIAKADMSAVGFLPEHVIGIATQDFSLNDFGFVTEIGKVRDLDTSGYSEGDILYLDPTTAGALTTTKPTPPNHAIQMCAVVRSHITQGTLLVRPTHMVDTDEVAEGSSNLYFTVARAVAAIKADGDWNASDWDTAFGWGDHASEGYLTSVAFNDLTSTPTTISGYGITDAFDGAYSSLTGKPTLFSGSYTDLTNKPTIPTVPTTVSSFTNDSGYITDYTVTQGDVTAHQSALSITESQISDLGNYLTSETNTVLQIVGNTLRYTDETGTNTDIDLSLYLDDTNLSRLISGSLDANGTATFTRDDDSTFTVDFSQFFDDTNLARITSAAFNTTDGVLTLTRDDATTITADLDGRYLTSIPYPSSSSWWDGYVRVGGDGVMEMGKYMDFHTSDTGGNADYDLRVTASPGVFNVGGQVNATGGNSGQWNIAYGWGDHSTQGYLTDTRAGFQVTSTQYAPAAVAYIPGNKAYFDVLVEFSNGVFFDIKASTSEGVISTRHNYVESGANPEIDAIFTTYNETEDRTYLGIYYATTGTYDITFTQNSINTDLVLFSAYTSGFEGSTYGTNAAYPSNNFFKGLADKAADAELLDGYNSSDFALVDNVYDKTAVNSISDWDNMPLGFGSNAQTDRPNQPKANVSITLTLENENSAGRKAQLFFGDTPDSLYFRPRQGDTVGWHSWEKLWTTASFSSTDVSNWNTAYGWGDHSTQNYATQTYVNNAVSNLVDSAPTTLDTLNELASALGDDPNFATTVTTSIATKWTQDNTKISNWDDAYEQQHSWEWKYITYDNSIQVVDATEAEMLAWYKNYFINITETTLASYPVQYEGHINTYDVDANGNFGGSLGGQWTATEEYHAHIYTNIYVEKPFTVTNSAFAGDDDHALFINGEFVAGSINTTQPSYTYSFKKGWYRIDLIFDEQFGGDYIQLGWNPKDYTSYISDMTPYRGGDNPIYLSDKINAVNNSSNWDTAYGWGNHANAGYLTTHQDISGKADLSGDTFTGMTIFEDGIRIGTGDHQTDGRASLTFGEGSPAGDSMYIEYDGENLSGDSNAIIFGSNKVGVGDIMRVTYGGSVKVGTNSVFHDAYHPNADKWTTARTLSLTGDVTGSVSWDGSANASITTAVANDSHTHDGRYYTESESDSRFARVYKGTATINTSYTTVATISGDRLASSIDMTIQGTSGNVVINVDAKILVNHSQDILIKTESGIYTQIQIKVTSNDNEAYAIEIARVGGSGDTGVAIEIFPRNSETVTFTSSHSFTGSSLNHQTYVGTKQTATGGGAYHLVTDGNISSQTYEIDGTTVINSSRDISNIGTISLAGTSSRPIFIGQAGSITTKGSSGGWSQGLLYYGSSNTFRGGFGALGTADTLDYFWIGSEYNDGSNFRFYPNGTFNIGANTIIDSSRNATFSNITANGAVLSQYGGQIMGVFKGHPNNNHMITSRGNVTGSNTSPVFNDGHQTCFIEHMAPRDDSVGFLFKDSNSNDTNTYSTLTQINTNGVNVLQGGYRINGTTVIDSSRNAEFSSRIKVLSASEQSVVLRDSRTSTSGSFHSSIVWNNYQDNNAAYISYEHNDYFGSSPKKIHLGFGATNSNNKLSIGVSAVSVNDTLQMNGTTIVDTSRNATFVNTNMTTGVVGGGGGIGDGRFAVRGGDLILDRGSELRWTNATGSGEYIYSKAASPYDVTIHSGSYDSLRCPNNGIVYIAYQGSTRITTTSAGVSVTGALTASGNITAYSDKRKKKDIVELESGLDYISKIDAVRFTWKDSDKKDIGFIAQDVEKHLPEFITDEEIYNYSEEAEVIETVKTMDYSRMTAVLWKAVKEQKSIVDEQQKQIENLTNLVNQLLEK